MVKGTMAGTFGRAVRLIPQPTVVSLFSGIMGLDLGFERLGFRVKVAVEVDKFAASTIHMNRTHIPIIQEDVRQVSTARILREAGLAPGGVSVVIGGPPCAPFTTAGRRKGLSDERGSLVMEFIRVVKEAGPDYFVMENVPGLRSLPLRHVSCYVRRDRSRELSADERLGSGFRQVLTLFRETGYRIAWRVLDAADFGVPQHRKRLFIVGSRNGTQFGFPRPTHGSRTSSFVQSGRWEPWLTFGDARKGLRGRPEIIGFPPSWGRYLRYVPPGGNWRNLPPRVRRRAMGGAYESWGGRVGFFRRLAWDEPAPTLVGVPTQKASCLAHPDKLRPLSVREYARLQGFPDAWKFAGSTRRKYQLIGQAVPIGLSQAVAGALVKSLRADPQYRCVRPQPNAQAPIRA